MSVYASLFCAPLRLGDLTHTTHHAARGSPQHDAWMADRVNHNSHLLVLRKRRHGPRTSRVRRFSRNWNYASTHSHNRTATSAQQGRSNKGEWMSRGHGENKTSN